MTLFGIFEGTPEGTQVETSSGKRRLRTSDSHKTEAFFMSQVVQPSGMCKSICPPASNTAQTPVCRNATAQTLHLSASLSTSPAIGMPSGYAVWMVVQKASLPKSPAKSIQKLQDISPP